MTKQPTDENLVSIIVPVYDVAEYLDDCLESVVNQTYDNIEIILVDDASTDSSAEKCDEWMRKDRRITVIHKEKNEGLSAARNTGLSQAHGEYISFVDSDDVISRRMIEKTIDKINSDQTDVVLFCHAVFEEDVEAWRNYKEFDKYPETQVCSSKEALEFLFHQQLHHYAYLRVVRKALYDRMGFTFPQGRKMEDIATTALVLGEAGKVSILAERLYFYRQRPGSTVSTWNHKLSLDSCYALDEVGKYICSRYSDIKCSFLNYKIKFLLYCWMSEQKNDRSADISRLERRKKIKEEIDLCRNKLKHEKLWPSNSLKLLLLDARILGIVKTLHG